MILFATLLLAATDPPVAAAPTAVETPAVSPAIDNTPEPYAPPKPQDTPEEIAADSARDLKDSRYYNKPGATRAQYDADWQECRLIARGSQTPAGSPVVVYNPAIISPAAAAGGGIIGALIGQAIVEGQLRRANRRACLMWKGWRLVEVEDSQAAAYVAMTDAERETYVGNALGAADPKGKSVQSWSNAFAEIPANLAIKAVK